MKIGISYNVWDNWQMLESNIRAMRGLIDDIHVSIVFQEVSNFGRRLDREKLLVYMNYLVDNGLVNKVVEYTPQHSHPAYNEMDKRQIGYNIATDEGCTHYMTMDPDEFYTKEQFDYAVKIIKDFDLDATICELINYWGDFKHQIGFGGYVSFMYKIYEGRKFVIRNSLTNQVPVDPTRQMPSKNICLFKQNELTMHHMSYVRPSENGMRDKIFNSACKSVWKDAPAQSLVDYYADWKPGMHGGKIENQQFVLYPLVKVENDFEFIEPPVLERGNS